MRASLAGILLAAGGAAATNATACTCRSDYPYCYSSGTGHDNYCYKSASSNEYSKTECAGSCTRSYAPTPPAPPKGCTCHSDYPYCYGQDHYCYKSTSSDEYSKTECAGDCTASYGPAPGPPSPPHPTPSHLDWTPLQEGLEAWAGLNLDAKFAVNVGDSSGTLFTWVSPRFSMTTGVMGASLSKWPAAIMLSGLVADGTMSYDDKANKYLKWWATDSRDPRSKVTLRHLLSFTSGYREDPDNSMCMSDFDTCAQKMYEAATSYTTPGTTWAYLSCHLQFAAAMAVAASGKNINTLFQEYLYKPFNMTRTSWSPRNNPSIAGGIRTTGNDFEQMLHRLLTYKALPKSILDQMETDYSQAPVRPSGDGWFGHYGMGHWWECLGYGVPSERSKLSRDCIDAHIQAGPGEYGYYPLLDRSGGGGSAGPRRPQYYFQVVLQEPDALSGVPEYLRIAAKPVADLILSGGNPDSESSRSALLGLGGGLITRDITYIQGELQDCTCSKARGSGEPWRSLTAKLPRDSARTNRRDIAKGGTGLLLRDIVGVQKSLGTCTCSGRK